MRRIIIILAAFFLSATTGEIIAQSGKNSDYYLQKAYEAIRDEEDYDKALEYVNEQLSDTPDDVSALLLRVRICLQQENYRTALADVNRALKVNRPRKTEVANSSIHWWKAYVYQDMYDYRKAEESFRTAYQMAKKDNKENLHSIGFDFAQCLYTLKKLDESDDVYREMIADDETDASSMVGLARSLIDRGKYVDALRQLQAAIRVQSDYAEIYRFMLLAYDKLGKKSEAVDAAIEYFETAGNPRETLVSEVSLKHLNYAVANIRAQIKESDKPVAWRAFLCDLFEKAGMWEDALKEYITLENEAGKNPSIYRHKGRCYSNLGMIEAAISELDRALERGDDWNSLCDRGSCCRLAGLFDKAIDDFTAAIEVDPRYAYPYYARGWCWELSGNDQKALEDYNLGIDIDTDYPYIYLQRGLLLQKMGWTVAAREDFEMVLRKDTVATDGSCTHYALYELGKDREAVEWMQKIVDENPNDPGNRYDEACLYARMGRTGAALDALEKAFENGYRNFIHMGYDHDMDPLRELPRYKDMVSKYKAIHENRLKMEIIPVPSMAMQVSEVVFSRHTGGTFEIPCNINGLPLHMIFDTGASDVTISSVEANFMLKNGYLSPNDIKGRRYYQVADGQISEGTVLTLREVKVGDAVLKNVDASVVKSQRAPLLLGQSVMERFGAITIDNENNKLIIKH